MPACRSLLGGALAALLLLAGTPARLSLDDGRIEQAQVGQERGASVRLVAGDATYFGHVDGLAEEDLMRVADSVSEGMSAGAREPAALRAAVQADGHPVATRPEEIGPEAKAESCGCATSGRAAPAMRSARSAPATPSRAG